MQSLYKDNGIKCFKNLPLDDTVLDTYEAAENVYQATQYLNDMLENKKCDILIHSATSHTRATTVLIAYLHIYQ